MVRAGSWAFAQQNLPPWTAITRCRLTKIQRQGPAVPGSPRTIEMPVSLCASGRQNIVEGGVQA
jgi:hypothetical protein